MFYKQCLNVLDIPKSHRFVFTRIIGDVLKGNSFSFPYLDLRQPDIQSIVATPAKHRREKQISLNTLYGIGQCVLLPNNLPLPRLPSAILPLLLGSDRDCIGEEAMIVCSRFLVDEMIQNIFHILTSEIQHFSRVLSISDDILKISRIYVKSYEELIACSPSAVETMSDVRRIVNIVHSQSQRHLFVQRDFSFSVLKYRAKLKLGMFDLPSEDLDRFHSSCISLRILQDHLTKVYKMYNQQSQIDVCHHGASPVRTSNNLGVVDASCDIFSIINTAVANAKRICSFQHIVSSPSIVLKGTLPQLLYIPEHISYIMLELVKNAFYATSIHKSDLNIPPITIIVEGTKSTIDICVVDHGVGIPLQRQSKVFQYGYSTIPLTELCEMCNKGVSTGTIPSHFSRGLGFGLPMSRLYARYFGGDLTLYSQTTAESHRANSGTRMLLRLRQKEDDPVETIL